jgi:outer membrane protein assembly factor BamA
VTAVLHPPGARWLCAFLVCLLPVAPALAQEAETIAEIRVHGNHTTPNADIIVLSGLSTGAPASDANLREAEERLRASRRFEAVEIRRRYRSIDNPSEILIVILVDELPAISSDDLTPGPFKRLRAAGQWLPIFSYEDGYGLTYGARVAIADVVGDRSRVSVPLSWGGERHAGVEVGRRFDRGPLSSARGGLSVYRRVNPHFDTPDLRQEASVGVERSLTPWLRAGVDARIAEVEFGPDYDALHTAAGLYVSVDTRIDPSFPRNAIQARAGWEHLDFESGNAGRWFTDTTGYIGLIGSTVLALRAQSSMGSDALPSPELALVGGGDSLRGYPAGHRAGDNLAAFSAELRVPINSALSFGRFGVKAFIDTGTTWASGEQFSTQQFDRGIGGGVYFGIALFVLDLDVAWPREGDPRVHFGMGVSF